jgi:hypothetical protein
MSVNKYLPHVWVIPEDDADRQLAEGFLLFDAVAVRTVGIRAPAGGWLKVLDVFETEYISLLRRWKDSHVVMLLDFDGHPERREILEARIPEELKPRVFTIGSGENPEVLRQAFQTTLERIGTLLAEECYSENYNRWTHPLLLHNDVDLQRLRLTVRKFVFQRQD